MLPGCICHYVRYRLKEGVGFYRYFHKHIAAVNQIPPLANLVAKCDKDLDLGSQGRVSAPAPIY
jgi:hypothetical protein